MIELIGVPFDLTGKAEGSRLGPDALRIAGIRRTLEALDLKVEDSGDLDIGCQMSDARSPKGKSDIRNQKSDIKAQPETIRNFHQLHSCIKALREKVTQSIKKGN